MPLINRVARLFKADFNAVLDRIEEPVEVLKQAVRDMEEELAGAERRVQLYAREQDALARRRAELESKLAEIDSELDLCFANNKEDLARSLVRRKLESARLLKRVDAKREANAATLASEQRRLDEKRTTLDGLKQKAEIFAEREAGAADNEPSVDIWAARELTIDDDEIDVAFLREQQARRPS